MPSNGSDDEDDPATTGALGQLSLFSSDGADPQPSDLEGLLLGTGHIVSREQEARISVLVSDRWRAELLVAQFELRGLGGEVTSAANHLLGVRTAFDRRLRSIALRWEPSAQRPAPTAARIAAASLRLWVIASGRPDEAGYLLRLAPSEQYRWERSGAALSALGLAGVLLGPRAGGPAYRVSGAKRMRRLTQLIGPAPDGADAGAWPRG